MGRGMLLRSRPIPRSSGEVMKIQIHDIWISPGHDFKGRHGLGRREHGMRRVGEAVFQAGLGIAGDRYHGENPGSKMQVTFLAREVVDDLCRDHRLPIERKAEA